MSPARRAVNKAIEKYSLEVPQKVLFVGVDKKWDYRMLFKSYETMDINEKFKPTIVGDIQECPQIADKTYDGVIMTGVYEYLQSPARAFNEINRILKERGQALICVPGWAYYSGLKKDMKPANAWWEVKPLILKNMEIIFYRDSVPYYLILNCLKWT